MELRIEVIQPVFPQIQHTVLESNEIGPRNKRIEISDDVDEILLAHRLVTKHRHDTKMLYQQIIGRHDQLLTNGDIYLIVIHVETAIVILDVAVLCQHSHLLDEIQLIVQVRLGGLIAPTALELLKVEVTIAAQPQQTTIYLVYNRTVPHYNSDFQI